MLAMFVIIDIYSLHYDIMKRHICQCVCPDPRACALGSIENLWYIAPVRCIIELTEKEQWGSYPLFPKTGAPGPWAGTEPSAPDS